MRFSVEQHLAHPLDVVAPALADPDVLLELPALGKLSAPELVDREVAGDHVSLALRFRFQGELSSAARAVLDPGRISWVERSEHDVASGRGSFTLHPDHYGDRLRCSGTFSLVPTDGGCRRRIEGDLRVRAPLVAGAVERAIVSGLRDHLVEQAAALDELLGRRGS